MQIGAFQFLSPVVLAPMAGISDQPFRRLCRALGADWAVSEMITARQTLWHTDKTRLRLELGDGLAPGVIQIAGAEPEMMAEAARAVCRLGADIVDINMGCPAKKVLRRDAGSALMRDEKQVAAILRAVVSSSTVPVTLKMRTGWDLANRNAPRIAYIAEDCGVSALTVHGRSRACAFRGDAEYETIAEVKSSTRLPVIANGDIDSVEKAQAVLALTGADGVMVGRAARGNPWLPGAIAAALRGEPRPAPSWTEQIETIAGHLSALHAFYGDHQGVRLARKHMGWYLDTLFGVDDSEGRALRARFNRLESTTAQCEFVAGLTWQQAA